MHWNGEWKPLRGKRKREGWHGVRETKIPLAQFEMSNEITLETNGDWTGSPTKGKAALCAVGVRLLAKNNKKVAAHTSSTWMRRIRIAVSTHLKWGLTANIQRKICFLFAVNQQRDRAYHHESDTTETVQCPSWHPHWKSVDSIYMYIDAAGPAKIYFPADIVRGITKVNILGACWAGGAYRFV